VQFTLIFAEPNR